MFEEFKTMTEEELRDAKTPWPKNLEELNEFISVMEERQHDYGTCAYAMSMCALATFYYMSSKLGVTNFQASFADLDFIKRSRNIKNGFRIYNFDDLVYPQYCNNEHFPTWQQLIEKHKEQLAETAKEKLCEISGVHKNVKKHWKYLASLGDA